MSRSILLLLTLCLYSCREPEAPTSHFSGIAMTMEYRVIIGSGLTKEERNKIQQIIELTFSEVNLIYNNWNPQSELTKFNNSPPEKWIKISPQLESLFRKTESLVKETRGLYDPTIASAHQLWKRKLENHEIPSQSELAKVKPGIGWNNIELRDGYVRKKHLHTSVDLGGIAKGYCVDLLADRLLATGHPNIYVEWGGEIYAAGRHPSNRLWNVFISNLSDTNPEHAIDIISLENQSVATSGDYLQQWSVGDSIYSHVIHPRTLQPVIVSKDNICSATVKARSCAFADALATACMLFESTDSAVEWAKEVQEESADVEFWFLTRNELMFGKKLNPEISQSPPSPSSL